VFNFTLEGTTKENLEIRMKDFLSAFPRSEFQTTFQQPVKITNGTWLVYGYRSRRGDD